MCNRGVGAECLGCAPADTCADEGYDADRCCANFLDVTFFMRNMTGSLGPVTPVQLYLFVEFATEASTTALLVSPRDALDALNGIAYAGGRTNHAGAIRACASTWDARRSGNVLLLITNGWPTVPGENPRYTSLQAAREAEQRGAFIIPVMITQNVIVTPESTAYLKELSTDGTVFEVSNFGALDSIRESLLA